MEIQLEADWMEFQIQLFLFTLRNETRFSQLVFFFTKLDDMNTAFCVETVWVISHPARCNVIQN